MIEPALSRKFVHWIIIAALGWVAMGVVCFHSSIEDLWTFLEAFLFGFLDLVFLILIFWKLFFAPSETAAANRSRAGQMLLFVFFKLVCLGFLAIILKRLRNASLTAVILGVGFIGIGPLIAGVIARRKFLSDQSKG